MNNPKRIFLIIAGILIIGFLLWYFSSLVIYLITSIMLAFMGSPFVKILKKIRIGKYHLPGSLSAAITLILIIILFALILGIFVPIIISQAEVFANLDINSLVKSIEDKFIPFEQKLVHYRLISKDQRIVTIVSGQIFSFIKMINVSDILNNILSLTGNIFIGVFAVLFTTFFLLKDEHLVYNAIMLITPEKYHTEMKNIMASSKNLLSRYFLGLMIDLTLITSCYSIGLSIFGVKNAILIGFIGGILHIIPYLGPLIGGSLGILLAIASTLAVSPTADIFPVFLVVIGVFIVTNIIDNIVFQPLIYSNSVKAHPLEIFFVVLVGDSVGGILGMIFAIPVYTLIRIVAKEFLSRLRIVQKLTERL